MGTENRRFIIRLPNRLAELCGEDTITITEERDGINGNELATWLAYYELENAKNKR